MKNISLYLAFGPFHMNFNIFIWLKMLNFAHKKILQIYQINVKNLSTEFFQFEEFGDIVN